MRANHNSTAFAVGARSQNVNPPQTTTVIPDASQRFIAAMLIRDLTP